MPASGTARSTPGATARAAGPAADRSAEALTLSRRGTGEQMTLGDLQVPVAVLVPDELVQGVGGLVEPGVGQALLHRPCQARQAAQDPTVFDAQLVGRRQGWRRLHWPGLPQVQED